MFADRLAILCFYFTLFITISAEALYGGSIYWRPTGIKNQVSFTYRLVWNLGNFPCGPTQKQSVCWPIQLNTNRVHPTLHRWENYTWACTRGCNQTTTMSKLEKLQYTDIAEFLDDSWETGVGIFNVTFSNQATKTDIIFGFKDPNLVLVDGLGEAIINLATRNDTNRSNIAPAINVFPIYRIPHGCEYVIRLFPFDGDGDDVRCHWYKEPDSSTGGIILYEDACEIKITAITANGFFSNMTFSLSIYAEDHSRDPVELTHPHTTVTTGPFSRVPVKLTIHIANTLPDPSSCNTGPRFLSYGTLEPYFKHSYKLPFTNARLPFKASGSNMTILTTGPKGLIYKYETDVNSTRERGEFSVSDFYFKGVHLACGQAYTADGIPGESRCAVLLVEDPDECSRINPCTAAPNGICNNLFEYYTCEYPKSLSSSTNTSYSKGLCDPVYITENGDDDLGVKVGVPVGLSILWLLILAFTVGYLKRYWMQKMKSSTVEPDPGSKTKLGDMMPA